MKYKKFIKRTIGYVTLVNIIPVILTVYCPKDSCLYGYSNYVSGLIVDALFAGGILVIAFIGYCFND